MSKVVNNNNNNYRSNFNQAVFTGNLAKAPYLNSYQTRSGKTVHEVYFTVLCDDYYNGYQDTNVISCVAYGQHADNIAKNFTKGSFVRVKSTIDAYPVKQIKGVQLKYSITVTRFTAYSVTDLRKHAKKHVQKVGQPKDSTEKPAKKTTQPKAKPTDGKTEAGKTKLPMFTDSGNQKIVISDDDLPF